mmetsp:Transcript_50022/g.118334  ORF Transcript_50022/g.118334 Transcript_50022/m.118334 type:complete len:255 (-) Transcript_50022:75-839(-)
MPSSRMSRMPTLALLVVALPLAASFSALPGSALLRRALPRQAARNAPPLRMVIWDDHATVQLYQPREVGAGMKVEELWERSIGTWAGLRSSHSIAFGQIEEVRSDMTVDKIDKDDPELIAICKVYGYEPSACASVLRISWESTSDWDDFEKVAAGSSVVALVKTEGDTKGKVLRSVGYTENIPAAGDWTMQEDGSFYMKTIYTGTGAEETIWFVTPDVRMRTSCIQGQGGKGVTTATFTTEVRQQAKKIEQICG